MMDRRDFIKTVFFLGTATAFAGPDYLFNKKSVIHIFHTNDVHSHIEPFPLTDKRFPGMGGYAKRQTMLKEFRKKYGNILLFDAGDVFQGTPYFNYYEGKLDYQLMSKLGYNAATLGNHDFDNGTDKLAEAMKYANFSIVSSNLNITHPILRKKVKPYEIYVRKGRKIGVFGLTVDFKGLVTEDNHKGVEYVDPVNVSKKMVDFLRKEKGCDIVICLSHLGISAYKSDIGDVELAEQVSGIDIIIGGHSHTFLDGGLNVVSKDGWNTLITQVGFAGVWLGHIVIDFDNISKKKNILAGKYKV